MTDFERMKATINRAAFCGIDGTEISLAIDNAETPSAFDDNISAIVAAKEAMGIEPRGAAWNATRGEWVAIP